MEKNYINISLYSNDNFGNKLQIYSIQKVFSNNRKNIKTLILRENKIKKILKMLIKILKHEEIILEKTNNKRYQKFIEFNKYISYIERNKIKQNNIYICGSDQIWNYGILGCKRIYFGKRDKLNISFSASFGVYVIPYKFRKQYKKGLSNFKAISVREEAGKRIVEELTGRTDVEVLVDPTMLLTAEEWDKVSKRPEQLDLLKSEKYILNYFLGELPEEWNNEINRIAKENECEVINILDKKSPFYQTGPSEFLYLEKNAFMVCTDSFHSSVFSIIYDTPFVVFDRQQKGLVSMNSRIDTLLSKFKLEDRRYNGKITEKLLKCDYTEAKKILEKEKEKSINFLKKALEME